MRPNGERVSASRHEAPSGGSTVIDMSRAAVGSCCRKASAREDRPRPSRGRLAPAVLPPRDADLGDDHAREEGPEDPQTHGLRPYHWTFPDRALAPAGGGRTSGSSNTQLEPMRGQRLVWQSVDGETVDGSVAGDRVRAVRARPAARARRFGRGRRQGRIACGSIRPRSRSRGTCCDTTRRRSCGAFSISRALALAARRTRGGRRPRSTRLTVVLSSFHSTTQPEGSSRRSCAASPAPGRRCGSTRPGRTATATRSQSSSTRSTCRRRRARTAASSRCT